MIPNAFRRPLAGSASWMLVGQAGRAVSQAAYFVLVARALGSDGFGAIAAALAVVSIAMPFAAFGMGDVLVRRASVDPATLRQAWGNALSVTVAGGSLLLLLAGLGGKLALPAIPLQLLLLLGGGEFFFARVSEVASQVFLTTGRMALSALTGVGPALARAVAAGGFVAVHARGTAETWGAWYLASSAAAAAFAFALVTVHVGTPQTDLRETRRSLSSGAFFSIGNAATTIYSDIDKMMLGRLAALAVAGSYAAGYRVVSLAFVPVMALLTASYPGFFRAGQEGLGATVKFARRLLRMALPYSLAVAVLLFATAPVVPLILGSDFRDAVGIIRWLAALPVILALYYFGADALTGAGRQAIRTSLQVATAIANIALNLWLIPRWGARGAAWSTLICYGFLAVSVWAAALGVPYREREGGLRRARTGLARL